ncbi:hypothetical protein IFM89_014391, partial [Coptis chinensis]
PDAEVIALSPTTLMATNRFLCEICGKGFQRDQNLQLHRRGHNVPWKLRQRSSEEPKKRVYVCPEKTCVHHQPIRALGDLTGIKKHFCRKHGEKKWKCAKCQKRYAVQSDWKAHLKTCGTREYKCDCGTIFSRRDSFLTHRAFCDALAEETAKLTATSNISSTVTTGNIDYHIMGTAVEPNMVQNFSSFPKPILSNNEAISQPRPGCALWMVQGSQVSETTGKNLSLSNTIGSLSFGTMYGDPYISCLNDQQADNRFDWFGSKLSTISTGELTSTSLPLSSIKEVTTSQLASIPSLYSTQKLVQQPSRADMSATALLQKAAQMGVTSSSPLLLNFGVKYNSNAQDRNKYGESLTPNPKLNTLATNVEKSKNDISATNLWQMYPSKRRNIQMDDAKEGQTRDFLGVGGQTTVCTSSINGYI